MRHLTLYAGSSAAFTSWKLEAFNAFDQPIWGDPDMNMSSQTYRRINTTRSPTRELQIGVTFSF